MSLALATQGAVLACLAIGFTVAYSHADIFEEPSKRWLGISMTAIWSAAAASLLAAGWVWAIVEGAGS